LIVSITTTAIVLLLPDHGMKPHFPRALLSNTHLTQAPEMRKRAVGEKTANGGKRKLVKGRKVKRKESTEPEPKPKPEPEHQPRPVQTLQHPRTP